MNDSLEPSKRNVPFELNGTGNLTRQMADGIRSAIASGFWKPGDALPTAAAFQKELDTGGFVPRTALRQLADEGVIILKKHVGAVVAPRKAGARQRRRVAFITSGKRESYYENVHAFALQHIFELANWELIHIQISRFEEDADATDLRSLKFQLELGLDFAICFTESRNVAKLLDAAQVKYIYEGGSGREFPNATATINLEIESQTCMEELAAHWKSHKVKDILVVDFEHVMPRNAIASFVQSGMRFSRLIVKPPRDRNYLQDIQQAGLDAVARFFAAERNRTNPPDAIFFYDDYLAAGGLIALAATGLRVPEDIRVATLANKGLGPVWFKPLTRLEYDPVGNARLIGDYVLKLLAGKKAAPPILQLNFIEGRT